MQHISPGAESSQKKRKKGHGIQDPHDSLNKITEVESSMEETMKQSTYNASSSMAFRSSRFGTGKYSGNGKEKTLKAIDEHEEAEPTIVFVRKPARNKAGGA